MTDIINDLAPFMFHRNNNKPSMPQSRPPMPQSRPPMPQSRPPMPQSRPPMPQSRPPMPQSRPPMPQSRPPMPQSRPPMPQSRPPMPQSRPPMPQSRPPMPTPTKQQQIKDALLNCLIELHEPFAQTVETALFTNTFNEAQFKIAFVDKLRDPKNKHLWARDTRVTTLPLAESNLTTASHINLPTFITLCMLENVAPFTIIYKNAFYRHTLKNTDDDDAPCANLCYTNADTGPKWHIVQQQPATLLPPLPPYEILHLAKPYKAISGYTVADLRALCEQLGLNADPAAKLTKPQLHKLITDYFIDWMALTLIPA